MLEKYEATIKNIQRHLNSLTLAITAETSSGSTSLSKYAESYFKPILNTLIEGSPFQVMEGIIDETIDLKNDSASVQIQVSSKKCINSKIKDTLKTSFTVSSTVEKPRLIFLFLADKHIQPQNKTKAELNKEAALIGYDFQFKRDVIELSKFSTLLKKLYYKEEKIEKKDGFKKIGINDLEYIEQYLEGTTGLERHLYRSRKKEFSTEVFDASADEVLGRERDLDKLLEFYDQEAEKIFIISAEPGMGKTSLCYKFFEENNIDPYFFDERSESVIRDLQGNELFNRRMTLFFIDDLQNFITDKDFMKTLSSLANNSRNKTKFIITLRSKKLLPNSDQLIGEGTCPLFRENLVLEHSLKKLSDDTIKEILSREISNSLTKDENISTMVEKIAGIPILLKHFLNCIWKREDINGLTCYQGGHLVNLVRVYIDQIKEAWQKASGDLKNEAVDRVLFLIALQNGVEISELTRLSTELGASSDLLSHLLEEATKDKILFERSTEQQRYRIRPELFSDAILVHYFTENSYAIKSFYKSLLENNDNNQKRLNLIFERLLKLKNEDFDSYQIDDRALPGRIRDLKDEVFFKKKISSAEELYSLESKLKILSSIAYRDPKFVLNTLEQLYSEQFSNNEFFLNTIKSNFNSLKDLQETIKEQFQIIMLNACDLISLDNSYELLMKYFKLFNNNLSFMKEAFRYLHYDFNNYGYYRERPLLRQKYFLDILKKKSKELDICQDDDFSFIYLGLEVLLSSECKPYSYYNSEKIAWNDDLWVYPSDDLINIRENALAIMQTLIKKVGINEQKKIKIYKFLLQEFWFIKTHSRKGNSHLDRVSELNQLFDFFLNELKEFPSIELKAAILNTFRLYKDDEIKKEFFDKKYELVSLAKDTKDNQEKLALFCSNEYLILDSDLNNQIKELIDSFPDIYKFIDTLIQVLEDFKTKEWCYSFSNAVLERITSYIGNILTNQAEAIYDYIFKEYNSYKYQFLDLLRPFFNEEDFFYSLMEKLWNPDDIQSHGYLSWMLMYGRDPKIFQEKDLEYFQIMLKQRNRNALDRISFSIYKYFNASFAKTRNLITEVWKLAEQEPSYSHLKNNILSFLFKDKNLNEKFKNELKLFIDEFFTNRINPFDEDSVPLLNFIENYYGFEELLSFIRKILEQDSKTRIVYQSYKNESKSEEESAKRYIRVLDFYFSQNNKERYRYNYLLDYFSPYEISSFYEQQVSNVLLSELNNYFDCIKGEDINKAKELLSFLTSRFYVDEKLCDFLVKAAIHIEKNLSVENLSAELTLIFNEEFLKNRGLTRRRLPQEEVYPADLEKRKVLENIINKYQPELTDSRVLDFLKTALRNVGYDLEK